MTDLTISSLDTHTIGRRNFLLAGFAAVIGATAKKQSPTLETFTQWLDVTVDMREKALPACLDPIRKMDQSIHAWVQVQPEQPTGNGRLSGIPFGVKFPSA